MGNPTQTPSPFQGCGAADELGPTGSACCRDCEFALACLDRNLGVRNTTVSISEPVDMALVLAAARAQLIDYMTRGKMETSIVNSCGPSHGAGSLPRSGTASS